MQSGPDMNPMISVTAQPHPLLSGLEIARVLQGCSLADLGAGEFVYAFVNGERIEDLAFVPADGDTVVLKAMASGGEGGKNALRMVASIALVVSANAYGAALAGSLGLGSGALAGAIGTAIITVGGQLALNALVPPPSQQLDAPNGFEPFRGISGNQNVLNPFGVIPRLYGTHRLYPPMAARSYSEQIGKEQYLRLLFCLGYGPLSIDEASFKLGDTALTEYEAEVEIREGTPDDAPITLFSRNVAETSLADEFDEEGDSAVRTSPIVSLDGNGKGTITLDFVAPALAQFMGTKQDYAAAGFKLEFKRSADSEWTVVKPVAQGGRATVVSGSEGGYSDYFPFSQDGTKVVVPNIGAYTDITSSFQRGPAFYLVGAESRPYGLSISIEVDEAVSYDFRVTRKFAVARLKIPGLAVGFNDGDGGTGLSGAQRIDDEEQKAYTTFNWTALRAIGADIAQSVPQGLAFVAMRIKLTDQLGGVVSNFSCVATSRLNVFEDGVWSVTNTSNPAWIYRDILRGSANARPVGAARVNDDDLYLWAMECIAEGREFNGVFDGRTTVFEALKNVAATGRGSFQIKDGRYTAVRDKPGLTPVQMFTPRNSWGFSGSRAFIKQPHGLKVKFKDRAGDWEDSERIVYADGYSEPGGGGATASELETLTLFGVTSKDQVWKDGRYNLAVARLRPETFVWNADIENLVCLRGDVVRHQHDAVLLGLGAGRIKSIVGTTINLDEEFTQEIGKSYQLRVRTDANVQHALTVVTTPGVSKAIVVSTVPAGIKVGDLAAFGETAKVTQDFLIIGITPNTDLQAQIRAVPYSQPAISESDSGAIPDYDPLVTQPSQVPPAPVILNVLKGMAAGRRNATGGITPRIIASYVFPSSNVGVTQVEGGIRRKDDPAFAPWPRTSNNGAYYFDISDLATDYVIRLRGISPGGIPGPWAEYVVVILDAVPEEIEAVALLEQVNNPETPNRDRSTIVVTVTPPADEPAYSHAVIDYRRSQALQWTLLGPTDENNIATVVVPRDGSEYVFRARAVSQTGYQDLDGPTASITLSDAQNGGEVPDPDDGATLNPALNVANLRLRDQLPAVSEFTGPEINLQWDPVTAPAGQQLRDYRVIVIDPTTSDVLRIEYVVAPRFDYTIVKNTADAAAFGYAKPLRELTFEVVARTRQGSISETPAAKTVSNPPPVLPVDFDYFGFFDAIELRFQRPTDGDYVGTRVHLSETSGFSPDSANLWYDGADTLPIVITGVPSGTTLYFRVILSDLFGEGSVSMEYSVDTSALPGQDATPPSVPTNLRLTPSFIETKLFTTGQLLVEWDPSEEDTGFVQYELEYWVYLDETAADQRESTPPETGELLIQGDLDPEPEPLEVGNNITSTPFRAVFTDFTTLTSYTIYPAEANATYFVRVRAMDKAGNKSEWTDTVSALIEGDDVPPGPATDLVVTDGVNKVILDWLNPTDADFLLVFIHRSTSAVFTPNSGNKIAETRANSYVDAAVENGTTYYYKLVAYDVARNASVATAAGMGTPFKITVNNITGFIEEGAIDTARFAAGIQPVGVVAALPSPIGYTGPVTVFLTTDGKLYRYTGGVWTAAIAAGDLAGQITSTQISDNAITTPKIAANAIEADQIAANAIVVGKIAAGAVRAAEIAADAVTTPKIAAGAVVANSIAANVIDASKIVANTITAAQIAASTITADRMNVSTLSSITADFGSMTSGTITGALIRTAASGARVELTTANGVRTINGSGQTTANLKPDGSGFIGLGGNVLTWDTAGVLTLPSGAISTGTIEGPMFRTTPGPWRVEIGAQNINLDGNTTTYVMAYRNGTASKLKLDQVGNMYLGGDLLFQAGGAIIRNKVGPASTANGFWIGDASGTPRVNIGDANNSLIWDGSALTVQGIIQTASSGQRVVLTSGDECEFYDDYGTLAATIGISSAGSDFYYFRAGVQGGNATQNTRGGIYGYSSARSGVRGESSSADGVHGRSVSGKGVYGSSTNDIGGDFVGAVAGIRGTSSGAGPGVIGQQNAISTGGSILFRAASSSASAPTHTAESGMVCVRFPAGVCTLYLQTAGGFGGTGNTWVALN